MSARRHPPGRRRGVIRHTNGVEAGGFRRTRHHRDRFARDEFRADIDVVGGKLHGKAHAIGSSAGGAAW
jgi:hypothetical protein